MVEDKLLERGLFPHAFKYIGYAISAMCIIYGIIYHIMDSELLFNGLHTPNMIFVVGLIIAISSKEAYEDERARQLRYIASTVMAGLLGGFILFEELKGNPGSLLVELSAALTGYVLFFHFIYYYGAEWIIKNRVKSWFIIVILLIAILLIYDLLWLA